MLCSARLDGSYAIRMLLHLRGFLHNSRDGARERKGRKKRKKKRRKKVDGPRVTVFERKRSPATWNEMAVDISESFSTTRVSTKPCLDPSSVSLSLSAYFIDEGATSFDPYGVRRSKHFLSRVTFFFPSRGTIVLSGNIADYTINRHDW